MKISIAFCNRINSIKAGAVKSPLQVYVTHFNGTKAKVLIGFMFIFHLSVFP